MRSCCVTCASAVFSARLVAGRRMTSSNVRRGAIDSTARRPLELRPNRRAKGLGAMLEAYARRRPNPTTLRPFPRHSPFELLGKELLDALLHRGSFLVRENPRGPQV